MHNAIQIAAERAPVYFPMHFYGPFSPRLHCCAEGELSDAVSCHITGTNVHHQLILTFTSCQLGWWFPGCQTSIKEINRKLIRRWCADNTQFSLFMMLDLDKEVSTPVIKGGGTVMSSGSVSLRKLMKLLLCHGDGCKMRGSPALELCSTPILVGPPVTEQLNPYSGLFPRWL